MSLRWLLGLVGVLALLGCGSDSSVPELLRLVDVAPSLVEPGDRLEVVGVNLPTREVREAEIVFRGELRKPGRSTRAAQVITVHRAQLASNKVSVVIDDALMARFCGRGEDAVHTTFHGEVRVEIPPTERGGLPVRGVVRDVTLDFLPHPPHRRVIDTRRASGERALEFFGLAVASDPAAAGGLTVTAVRPGSPADAAKLAPGDEIVSLGGVRILQVADVAPAAGARSTLVTLRRGGALAAERTLSVDGLEASGAGDLAGAAAILGGLAAVLLFLASPVARGAGWLEHRTVLRLRRRIASVRPARRGLGRAGVVALRSAASDALSLAGDDALARLAPHLAVVGASAMLALMPFAPALAGADLDAGVVFLVVVTFLVTLGLLAGGDRPRWSLLAGLRRAALVLVTHLPAAAGLLSAVVLTGSLRLTDLVGAQAGVGGGVAELGGWPWLWLAFKSPVTLLLLALFLSPGLLRHRQRTSAARDAADGGSSAGLRGLVAFLADWIAVLGLCGVASAVFLGGWLLPGVAPADQLARPGWMLLGALLFLAKSWLLGLAILVLRWILPVLSVEDAAGTWVKVVVPLAIGTALLTQTAGEAVGPVAIAVGLATLGASCVLLSFSLARLRRGLRSTLPAANLNPFL